MNRSRHQIKQAEMIQLSERDMSVEGNHFELFNRAGGKNAWPLNDKAWQFSKNLFSKLKVSD